MLEAVNSKSQESISVTGLLAGDDGLESVMSTLPVSPGAEPRMKEPWLCFFFPLSFFFFFGERGRTIGQRKKEFPGLT